MYIEIDIISLLFLKKLNVSLNVWNLKFFIDWIKILNHIL